MAARRLSSWRMASSSRPRVRARSRTRGGWKGVPPAGAGLVCQSCSSRPGAARCGPGRWTQGPCGPPGRRRSWPQRPAKTGRSRTGQAWPAQALPVRAGASGRSWARARTSSTRAANACQCAGAKRTGPAGAPPARSRAARRWPRPGRRPGSSDAPAGPGPGPPRPVQGRGGGAQGSVRRQGGEQGEPRRARAGPGPAAPGPGPRPPPRVRRADWSRRMKRSPRSAPIGGRARVWARPRRRARWRRRPAPPPARCTWAAPRWQWTGVQCAAAAARWPARRRRSVEAVGSGRCRAGCRAPSRRARPRRRCQAGEVERAALAGAALRAGRFWAWMPRTRTSMPGGEISSRSPTRTRPPGHRAGDHGAGPGEAEAAVHGEAEAPAARRGRQPGRGGQQVRRKRRDAVARSGRDRKDRRRGEAGAGQQARGSRSRPRRPAPRGTRSILVSATRPRSQAEQVEDLRGARGSAAWGRRPPPPPAARSRCRPRPATMVWTKRSWPGTSTKPSACAAGERLVGDSPGRW